MTIVTLDDDAILPARTGQDLQMAREPTIMDTVTAFAKDGLVGSAYVNITNSMNKPVLENDPNYDIFNDPRWQDQRYSGYIDRAVGKETQSDAEALFRKFDSEADNRAVLGASGTAASLLGMLATAPLDPLTYVPLAGAAYKAFKTGSNVAKGAAQGAAMVGAATAANEVALHQLQETRTKEDSAANVVGSMFIGGVIGSVSGALGGGREAARLRANAVQELKANGAVVRPQGQSVGAALANTTSLSDKSFKGTFGLAEVLAARSDYLNKFENPVINNPFVKATTSAVLKPLKIFSNPVLQVMHSPSLKARTLMEQLADHSMVTNENSNFISTGPSVENLVKDYERLGYSYAKERDRLFLEYRTGNGATASVGLAKKRVAIQDLFDNTTEKLGATARPDKKLTYGEFKEAISNARIDGGVHEIPQVAAAAKAKKDTLIDPVFRSAKEAGVIHPDTPETDDYLSRLWDHNAIKANRRQFEDLNFAHLQAKRDKAAAELEQTFKLFDLGQDSRVASAIKSERDTLKAAKKDTKVATADAAASAGKEAQVRLSINELESRMADATKNQQRIYNKILNKRERGDAELSDLFNEFRAVSSAKKELYKRVALKSEKADAHSVESMRRQAIADHFAEQEKLLEDKLAGLEKNTDIMNDLEYRAGFDDDDLRHVAYQLTERILGSPTGRLSYDHKLAAKKGSAPGKRGPAKARVYDIPNTMVRDFIVKDDDILTHSYVKSLGVDIELTKKFGTIDPEEMIAAIQADYEALSNGVTDSKILNQLKQAKDEDSEAFRGVWERLRGTYGNNGGDDYASGWRSAERSMMNLNYLSHLGTMVLSAFADVGRPVMVHGGRRTMGDGFAELFTNSSAFMRAAEGLKEDMAVGLDMVTNTRAKALFSTDEFAPVSNKVEQMTSAMAQHFGVITLMAPWNAAMKQFAGVITQNRMARAVLKLADGGTLSKREIENLASHGIDENSARAIAAQIAEHGEKAGRTHIPNVRYWTDIKAAETFRAAVRKQVDEIIITPGQDKPLWMSKSVGRMIGQFRSFAMASTQRTMLSGLQQRDAAVLNGVALSVALGSLSYIAKSAVNGYPIDDSPEKLLREGVDRSGVLAWLSDANAVAEKLSRGHIGAGPLLFGDNKPVSRYASRSSAEAILGPSLGAFNDILQISGSAVAGDWNAGDTHTARRLMPYNNMALINMLYDKAEEGINGSLGIPNRRK